MAAWRTYDCWTRRLTKPHLNAYSPETALPVKIISLARFSPMLFTSRMVPPSINGTPNLLQKTPNVASGCDTIMSHQHANYRPPATAKPYTAAITGFEMVILEGPIGPIPECVVFHLVAVLSWLFDAYAKSNPAQKTPYPWNMAISLFDSSNSLNAWYSCWAVSELTQFLTSGLFILIIVIRPPSTYNFLTNIKYHFDSHSTYLWRVYSFEDYYDFM